MFRPLEAIFRLRKIDLEEKEYNIYSKRNGGSIYCIPSLPDLFCVT